MTFKEYSNCGVGFTVSLAGEASRKTLDTILTGLENVEHRGGIGKDKILSDGAGILVDIPWEILGYEPNSVAVAQIFAPQDEEQYQKALRIFESTFFNNGLKVLKYRDVPTDDSILSPLAKANKPKMVQAIIERPEHCRTNNSFDKLLYFAKQMLHSNHKLVDIEGSFFFVSLSCQTIVYKALTTSHDLSRFYKDLNDKNFKTKLGLFHRRFSTNTLSSWDKVQPFRLIAHNGEINTIEGNKSAALSREKSLGLREDELIMHNGTSDSGTLNGMVEALKYRSSIPSLTEILAIMVPPAKTQQSSYFQFWSRAMEPWDGPALIAYCDGKRIGARLDRNGFRPARWKRTKTHFYLASEAGCFELSPKDVTEQGTLYAGRSVSVHIPKGEVSFSNPDQIDFYKDANFDTRLIDLDYKETKQKHPTHLEKQQLFYYTKEDLQKELYPMIQNGKEAIGSMGDTARLPAMSSIHRSIYDYFYQNFAQVTNPPLDYIREEMVTELKVYLGRKPNIFEPKEMIPPTMAIKCNGPILSLGEMEYIEDIEKIKPESTIRTGKVSITFDRKTGKEGFLARLDAIVDEVITLVQNGKNIIVLSDRDASFERPGIPAILAMRAVQLGLNKAGLRLRISMIVDSGEIRNSHQVAVLIGFGASAVCPYLALEIARFDNVPGTDHLFENDKEKKLIKGLEQGLLKIMAKRGISVVRSYQGAELFTIIGLGKDILEKLFSQHDSFLGGLNFDNLVQEILIRTQATKEDTTPPNNFLYKEHASGKQGESHSLTSKQARAVHKAVSSDLSFEESLKKFQEFKNDLYDFVNIRDMFELVKNPKSQKIDQTEILKTFGCGAMSFGAISAEAQRDLILAFNQVGGRSNSGEGGENPYYETEGISATTKQIASGRFGVTARYLTTGSEIQIKIAQGAKPGEGGQLMGIKVNEDIAKARYASVGVDLISPPPQHDIYSIEDLRQLIYELKQLHPTAKVSVKLVSGQNIGPIALGVVKAGADIIQISGGDGGTGAAPLMSMKHAGLPWEVGLLEVHKILVENDYRENVILRTDGGMRTGRDIIIATLFGAEEFDFGKMALVSQGCIMARICEKNTCPAGIASHDPKVKARYKGKVEEIVTYLKLVANDVAYYLNELGFASLTEIVGKRSLLKLDVEKANREKALNLDLSHFLGEDLVGSFKTKWDNEKTNELNEKILLDITKSDSNKIIKDYKIKSNQRAIPATLIGNLAISNEQEKTIRLNFEGSAGQGFGVFNNKLDLYLYGEANDSVAKGMSGGKVVITPHKEAKLDTALNVLVGNACLYGATGGTLYLNGLASDRFAVRNSGATAVTCGVGLHACEYMTAGKVIILGRVLDNVGAGMTGGEIYLRKTKLSHINPNFIKEVPITSKDKEDIKNILNDYIQETNCEIAKKVIDHISDFSREFAKCIPLS